MGIEIYHGRRGSTVFVDALRPCRRNKQWRFSSSCHLFTFPGWEEDMHEFAVAIGLRRCWYQAQSVMPHYDLTAGKRVLALAHGAVEVDRSGLVDAIRTWRAEAHRHAEHALELQHQQDQQEAFVFPASESGELECNRLLSPAEVQAEFSACRARIQRAGRSC